MSLARYIKSQVLQDLEKKMVFIGGPRQVGKTTMAKQLLQEMGGAYLNWDNDEDRARIKNKQWRRDLPLVVFDELHKYGRWKQWIKGVWDTRPIGQTYLVTGSARLDIYKKSGDSLLGRYHYWRLHPFTLDDLPHNISLDEGLCRLMQLGGFPEPFLAGDLRESRRWRRERFTRIIREDIRDLQQIKDLSLMQIFVEELRSRAGQLITISNLARDLEISPKTAKSWLEIAEQTYICFAVYPLLQNIPRSLIKPPKVFFYDNADTSGDKGTRFENLVATTLLKRLNFFEDYHGYDCKLHYIRDKDGREVDFAVIIDGKICSLIEVKLSSQKISTALLYYKNKLEVKDCIQLTANPIAPYEEKGVRLMSIHDFCSNFIFDQL